MQEERAAITAAAEKRSALLARIAAGENVDDGNGGEGQQRVLRNFKGAAGEGDNDDKYGSMEYRKAFMKYVCRGEALPKEYRADAVSKSTDVGAVIPTTVLISRIQHSAASVRNGHRQRRKWGVKRWSGWTN